MESITLQDDGSMITNKVICIEAEPSGLNVDELPIPGTKPLDLENIWGVPKEDLPETEPKNYFEQCEEELRDECLR